MLTSATLVAAASPDVIWVEAERFRDTGGWVPDWQFMDTMGSPYLLANSVGKPVDDAATTVPALTNGTFRLWVRCKDWLPKHSPGKFRVLVNDKPAATVFGAASTDAWQWVDGGEFELEQGRVTLRLQDLTGWWGRCDAIVLSRSIVPSNDAVELARQREVYGGVSATVEARGPYDVVVVGGGLAGCAAAVAAARNGCSVALVQDRPTLGGNASSEIGVAISGDTSKEPLDPRETGIVEELVPPTGGAGRSPQFEKVVRDETNIDLLLGIRATGVTMAGPRKIRSVLACNPLTGQRLDVSGTHFIDCTGDAWVGFWAGADYRTGREGTAEYGEPAAPAEADPYSLSTSLNRSGLKTHDAPVPFKAPAWAYSWAACSDFDQSPKTTVHSRGDLPPEGWHNTARGKGRHPERTGDVLHAWWLEFGGVLNTIQDAERIRDEIFRIKIGLWDHVKNHCPRLRDENVNREFASCTHIAAKRESRRLLGDYVFSQRDYMERRTHPDTVFYAGYNVDPHHPQGFWTIGAQAFRLYHYKVSVPYRILYSRNVNNLFMAGRNVSATHLGMNGVRVMRTTCMMGQVVGTAAGLAKAHETSARGVGEQYIGDLQQALLRDGCYLMGVHNTDPADLARRATVTASSSRFWRPGAGSGPPHGGTTHTLDADRAVMFLAPGDALQGVELYLRSDRNEPVRITATLCAAASMKDFANGKTVCTAQGSVPPQSEGWVRFPLAAAVEEAGHYFVWIPATPGLRWDLYPEKVPGTARAYRKPRWQPMSHCYRCRLIPGGELPECVPGGAHADLLKPENVIDGWNRAVSGRPNSWAPDATGPGPHWLEFTLAEPSRINAVHVTFQQVGMHAAAYDLLVPDGKAWRTILEVRRNTQRRRADTFPAVNTDRLRLQLRGTDAQVAQTQICEVRIYGE